jgi:hypothetical protein
MASRSRVSPNTVAVWRRRYRTQLLTGLRIRLREGRARRINSAKEQAVISATLHKPKVATHWSARRPAKRVGLSPSTVYGIWQKYGLRPDRVETFKFSRGPEFDANLADIVRLYLGTPERALVLCVDEKAQIQARNQVQPVLPMWPGLPAYIANDYTRHSTTSLISALKAASSQVHRGGLKRHTHLEFVAFLESLTRCHRRLELNLVCDNYGTHKHPAVRQWLAAHASFHLQLTQTSATWASPGRLLVRPDHRPGDSPRQVR